MRKLALLFTGILVSLGSFAQEDLHKAAAEAAAALLQAPQTEEVVKKPSYWTNSVQFDLGFSQTSLTNWAKGGYNTLTLNSGIDAKANYAKDLASFNNRLQLQYGFLWSSDKKNLLQKSNDLMYLESRFAFKTSKEAKWSYSASFDFRSQFTDSYDNYSLKEGTDLWEGKLKSGLFSPAITNIALGMEWVPNEWISVNIAPLTGGFTICQIPSLRKNNGMKLLKEDLDGSIDDNYRNALFQFGAQIKANFKMKINNKFSYETQFVFFTDYLNKPFTYNRINWDNKVVWSLGRFFNINFSTWLIYDPIVLIDGTQKVQFKEFFSVNFTYSIKNK